MSGSGSDGAGRQALEQRQKAGGGRPSRDLAEGVLGWLRPARLLDAAAPAVLRSSAPGTPGSRPAGTMLGESPAPPPFSHRFRFGEMLPQG